MHSTGTSHPSRRATEAEFQLLTDAHSDRNELSRLLQRIAQGDREAFTSFYRGTSGRVYRLARRILIDPELSAETTQEIFLQVWTEAANYDQAIGSPMAWLTTITHRRAVDKVRSEQSSTDRQARWAAASQTPDYDNVSDTVIARSEATAVFNCLRTLSPLQREAIQLAYYNGLSYREVAEKLSTPLSTVKTRIRDGLTKLKDGLGTA